MNQEYTYTSDITVQVRWNETHIPKTVEDTAKLLGATIVQHGIIEETYTFQGVTWQHMDVPPSEWNWHAWLGGDEIEILATRNTRVS
jgi:hypothetical protein